MLIYIVWRCSQPMETYFVFTVNELFVMGASLILFLFENEGRVIYFSEKENQCWKKDVLHLHNCLPKLYWKQTQLEVMYLDNSFLFAYFVILAAFWYLFPIID